MSIEWQCDRFFLRLWPELSQKCVETENGNTYNGLIKQSGECLS